MHKVLKILLSFFLLLLPNKLSLLEKTFLSSLLVFLIVFLLDSPDFLFLFHYLNFFLQLYFLFFVLLNRSRWLDWAQRRKGTQQLFFWRRFFFNFLLLSNSFFFFFLILNLTQSNGFFKLFFLLSFSWYCHWHSNCFFQLKSLEFFCINLNLVGFSLVISLFVKVFHRFNF